MNVKINCFPWSIFDSVSCFHSMQDTRSFLLSLDPWMNLATRDTKDRDEATFSRKLMFHLLPLLKCNVDCLGTQETLNPMSY
jgi:hypothetical protein